GTAAADLEIADIRTSNQEHEVNCEEEELQALPVIPPSRLEQGLGINCSPSVGIWITPAQIVGDMIELGSGLGQRHACLQPPEHGKTGMIIAQEHALVRAQVA